VGTEEPQLQGSSFRNVTSLEGMSCALSKESVDFDLNRTSSNSAFNLFNLFNLFNPSYNGLITYSFTQHLLRDFGRAVNSHQIRIARNNEKISELQFELQIMDLITQTK